MQQLLFFITLSGILLTACQPKGPEDGKGRTGAPGELPSAPFSPDESLEHMRVAAGFEIKLVAAEPLVNTPVALTFDATGRIWVVEMQGYMPDAEGRGEDLPSGKIVILEDHDKDGVADERKLFMDSLILPRAICLIENGVLIAAPPALWFVEIENDRPGKKVLVDAEYAAGGNPESQPNALLRGLDNWIYSAGSDKRYRKKGEEWLIEKTHLRGQWGLTQDDHGRLFYNNNSRNLLGDLFTPGLGAGNSRQRTVAGFNENIVPDNRVFPARPTPGVNRGYREGILDDSLRLVKFTSACGPLLYRGNLFGSEYDGNAFVAEPAAHLVKWNVLSTNGHEVSGRHALEGKEFLTSTDERFRPVSLYNGPDGALYLVDMYRGIIQHKDFLTAYLKEEIRKRELQRPLDYGRIYKIIPENSRPRPVRMPEDPFALVGLLAHPNGWVRAKAQQMLVDGAFTQVIPALRQLLPPGNKSPATVHALWTLEGLNALTADEVLMLLEHPDWPVRMQSLSALPSVMNRDNYKSYLPVLKDMLRKEDSLAAPYVAFIMGHIRAFDKEAAEGLLWQAATGFPDNEYVAGAVISNLENREAHYLEKLMAVYPDSSLVLAEGLRKIIANVEQIGANKRNNEAMKKTFPKGYALYTSLCQPCHGAGGNGVKSLAPPLNGSEWVTGETDKLIAIVLYGLTGPVEVKGTLYTDQEVSGDMPGIGGNRELKDEDIAELLSFIRHSWSNRAGKVTEKEMKAVRKEFKDRQKAFTAAELSQ